VLPLSPDSIRLTTPTGKPVEAALRQARTAEDVHSAG
jgi:hypothetical protein